MKYTDVFERSVRVHGDETAIVTDEGIEFTYAVRPAEHPTDNGFTDRIGSAPCAILVLNGPAAAESVIAGHKRGVPTVQLSFRGKASELVRMAELADDEALIFDDANAETAVEMLDQGDFTFGLHTGDADVDAEEVESYEAFLEDAPETVDTDLPIGDKTNVFRTSGTASDASPGWYERMVVAALRENAADYNIDAAGQALEYLQGDNPVSARRKKAAASLADYFEPAG